MINSLAVSSFDCCFDAAESKADNEMKLHRKCGHNWSRAKQLFKRKLSTVPAPLIAQLHGFKALPACFAALSMAAPLVQQACYAPPLHPPDCLLLKLMQHHLGL